MRPTWPPSNRNSQPRAWPNGAGTTPPWPFRAVSKASWARSTNTPTCSRRRTAPSGATASPPSTPTTAATSTGHRADPPREPPTRTRPTSPRCPRPNSPAITPICSAPASRRNWPCRRTMPQRQPSRATPRRPTRIRATGWPWTPTWEVAPTWTPATPRHRRATWNSSVVRAHWPGWEPRVPTTSPDSSSSRPSSPMRPMNSASTPPLNW